MEPFTLSDEALLALAEDCAQREKEATADLIACLAEIERRDLVLALGYAHLFDFCVRRLRYSEGAAGRRASAARAIRKSPEALSHIRDRSLTLSALQRLEPYLGKADSARLLSRAANLDREGLEQLVMEEAARRRAQSPAEQPPDPLLFSQLGGTTTPLPEASGYLARPTHPSAPRPADRMTSSGPGRIRLSFDADKSLRLKLEAVGSLLSNKLRDRRLESLIGAMADIVVSRMLPKNGRSRPGKGNPRRPTWAVRRTVWQRDGGRCAYTAADGTRCSATRRLQYDHVVPWAMGGRSDDPANIRLLCRAHNLREGRKAFPEATARALAARTTSSVP